jgi:hypothetical protein
VKAWIAQHLIGVRDLCVSAVTSHTPATRDVNNNKRRCFSVETTDAQIGSLDSVHVMCLL